jgi:hypothetical protein
MCLYVRELGDGHTVAVPVDFPQLAADGQSVDAAISLVTEKLANHIRGLPPLERNTLRQATKATLALVQVPVGQSDPVEIPVAVVVVERGSAPDPLLVIRAPAVASFAIMGRRREQLLEAAAAKLSKLLTNQPMTGALAAHEVGPGRLHWVEVGLPTSADANPEAEADDDTESSPLAQYGQLLTSRKDPPSKLLDLREEVIVRVMATLAKSERSSVVLVGPNDVGKQHSSWRSLPV